MRRATIDHLRGHRELWLTIGAALLIAFITRPVTRLGPEVWTEAAWQSALHQAFNEGVPFGGDGIVFTYGPLGFLELPTYWYGTTGATAVLVSFIEPALVAGLLIAVLRGRFGWATALGCAFIALLMRDTVVYHPALPLAAVIAALYVVANPRPDRVRALALIGGILAGYATLGRINAGIVIAAVVGVAVLFCDDRRRNVPLAVIAGVVTFLLGWVASGQSLGQLPGYIPGVLDIISGYSEGVGLEDGPKWHYPAAVLIVAGGFAAAWFTGRNGERDCRAGLACVWLVFSFLAFKQGFVRHDFHALFFIQGATVALLAMPWLASQRSIVLGVLGAMTLIYVVSAHQSGLSDIANVPARTASSAKATWLIVDSGRRHREITDGNREILQRRAVPPQIQAKIKQGTWAVWPAELSIIRAAGGDLKPLPTLQSYVAPTADLDRRNADALRDDSRAPDHILYLDETLFDRRLPALDAPETTRAMACNYKAEPTVGPYTVLNRTADRCKTPPRALGTVKADWDDRVSVPEPSTPNSFVYARIDGAGVSGLERLRAQLLRAYARELRYYLNKTDPPAARHLLIPGSAQNGIVLRAGDRTDVPRLKGFALGFPEISAWRADNPASDGQPLSYRFYEQRVSP